MGLPIFAVITVLNSDSLEFVKVKRPDGSWLIKMTVGNKLKGVLHFVLGKDLSDKEKFEVLEKALEEIVQDGRREIDRYPKTYQCSPHLNPDKIRLIIRHLSNQDSYTF